MADYIHNHKEFTELLKIVSSNHGIDITLVEKDYWIMHVLYMLQKQGIDFELKGGTSLSKGFGIIHRFSEDIDIHINNDFGLDVYGNSEKRKTIQARKTFYDVLSEKLQINGIIQIERDHSFDDKEKYRSGGIRLTYQSHTPTIQGLKDGILLEVGFDTVTPNIPVDISSWVRDYINSIGIPSAFVDNTARNVKCYAPGYSLVEKIQTIIRKFRSRATRGDSDDKNFMRQYYDIYCLLGRQEILDFIKTSEYAAHKKARIKGADSEISVNEHPAFLLEDADTRVQFKKRYESTASLYYKGQPAFDDLLQRIQQTLPHL